MHESLGEGWVAERNRRVGEKKIEQKEPVIRQARELKAAGMTACAAAKIIGINMSTVYFYYRDRFAYLDPVATEPTASLAA